MLLTTYSPISGVAAKKNAGTIVYGGNVPSGDRVTRFPSTDLLGTQNPLQYINANASSGLYTSGINGGTLAQNDRDDAIIYYSQKGDLGGIANTSVGKPVAGPRGRSPNWTLSGSFVQYPSGWNWATGQPIATPVVGGETWGTSDGSASGVGEYVIGQGNINPTSGAYPTRI